MKEEDLPCFIDNGRGDLVKGSMLIWVQVGNILCCQLGLFNLIILVLLLDKVIA